MKLCVTSGIIERRENGEKTPFAQTLAFLKEAGFEEMDFSFDTPDLLQDGWQSAFREKFRQAKDAGVRVRYAHLPFDYPNDRSGYGWDDFLEASRRAVGLAVEADVDCAAIHPRTAMTREYDAEKEHENAVKFLAPYCALAKEAGLSLALENMRGAGQSAPEEIKRYGTQTAELIRMADELEIGVCWDTGHANISAQDQRISLEMIGKRLRMVHINDNFAEDDVHTAPFLGTVDWKGVCEGLKAVGFSGSINLEVSADTLPEELRLHYARYMAASAEKLRAMLQS